MKTLVTFLACAAIALTASDGSLRVGSQAPAWTLPDSSDTQHSSSQYANKVLLLIGGDKKSQDSNTDWGNRVRKTCPTGFDSVGIANTSAVPRLLRGYYKSQFRTESEKMGVPYLLDWDGLVSQKFGFKPDVSNVVLVGPDNSVRLSLAGPADDDAVKKVCTAANNKSGAL